MRKKERKTNMINPRKAVVVGLGAVGASIVFALMEKNLYGEIVLIDANTDKAQGEAMDLSHGLPFAGTINIHSGTYEEVGDASLIIITAGAAQKPGETRLDLIDKNIAILQSILKEIKKTKFEGNLLLVANPVDVLTHEAVRLSGYPEKKVFGSGTVLDTARLKYNMGTYLGVDIRSVHTMIIGEHGDSEVPLWGLTNISGVPLDNFCRTRGIDEHQQKLQKIYEQVRDSAYEIIAKKGSTCYGIAMAVTRICAALVRDEKSVLTLSYHLHGEYGIEDVAMAVPCIVGSDGVEGVLEPPLTWQEHAALQKSAEALKKNIAEAEKRLEAKKSAAK